jgi:hypothetical protein
MGGTKTKTVVNKQLTAQRQAQSDVNARNRFATNYNAMFNELPNNETFADSLSGYYGGASLADIGKKLARTNTFTSKVKPSTYKVKTGGGGLFGSISKYIPSPAALIDPVESIRGINNLAGVSNQYMPPSLDPMSNMSGNFNIF